MPGRSLRRVRIAAAARPNSAIIGGAGTSWPPLEPDDDEDELLLDELDEDEELLLLPVDPVDVPVELDDEEELDEDDEELVLLVMSPEVVPG